MSEDIVERRMSAYYYEFTPTNVDAIDKVLSAVACAGKAFHHTEQWTEEAGAAHDHTGGTPVEWIQNAAREAADEIERLRAENAQLRATTPTNKSVMADVVAKESVIVDVLKRIRGDVK